MPKKEQKPQIRFKGFTDDWEQRKLSTIATMHARIGWQNLRTSEFLDSGDYYLITGTDFNDGEIDFKTCHFVAKERYAQDKNIQIKNGSILITKDGTLGKVAYVESLDKPATLNAGVFNVTIVDKNFGNKYLFQYLKAPFLMDYVEKKATGGTIKHLNQNILVDFPIVHPSYNEQTKISAFFSKLDNLITLHQRKYEKLKNIKKSMLEKMFPKNENKIPEIRFKGFTDDWEQRKLDDIADDIADGPFGSNLKAEHYTEEKEARIVQLSNIGETGWHDENVKYTTFTHAREISRSIVTPNSLIMAKMMPAGMTIICPNADKMYVLSSDAVKIKLKNNINATYFVSMTKSKEFLQQIDCDAQGSTRTRTSISKIRKMNVPVPELSEQTKIGAFFSKLDNLITLHQRKYEKLKNIKKSMLEKMFV